ncbi:hypothetical protein Pla163_29920 [Planctomycetes bacterium Pla163]|uniref:Uncharacterized protein n=1 Tax=Rohdeia mirabilis TaxID=2528008 RepID=A0A518D2Z6_9BACT|nr:hypothetical protein Pla163_29920 [Planctomycetes bacterium Pla163]
MHMCRPKGPHSMGLRPCSVLLEHESDEKSVARAGRGGARRAPVRGRTHASERPHGPSRRRPRWPCAPGARRMAGKAPHAPPPPALLRPEALAPPPRPVVRLVRPRSPFGDRLQRGAVDGARWPGAGRVSRAFAHARLWNPPPPEGVRRAGRSAPRRPPARRCAASAFRRLEHEFERCCEMGPIRSAANAWIAARRWRLRAPPRHTRRGRPSPGWPVGATTLDGHPPSTPASERMRRRPCPGPLHWPVRHQRHVRARERQARSSARRGPSRRTTPGARPPTAAWPRIRANAPWSTGSLAWPLSRAR